MDDFFNAVESGGSAANSEDIKKSQLPRRDVRYDRQVITVTSAENVKEYKVKVWPTIGDENGGTTNALGIPNDALVMRHRKMVAELRQQERDYHAKAYSELYEAMQSEMELHEAESQKPAFTVEELEQIRNEACEEGREQGYKEGFEKGLSEGLEKGVSEGLEKGSAEGLEKGYDEGFKKGAEEGFEKGHSEGIESGQTVVLEQVERFRYLADCLANPLREVDRDVTDEIVYMISRLVKVITHKEVSLSQEFFKSTIEKAMTVLPGYENGATIFLNREDLDVVTTAIGREYIEQAKWNLQADDNLSSGDIRVCNESSEVNWRLEDRIDSLLNDFLSGSYPAVEKALKESIENCPEYDEKVKPMKKASKSKISEVLDTSDPADGIAQENLSNPDTGEAAGDEITQSPQEEVTDKTLPSDNEA
ncbi:MAG: FliH/SctL family protein [Succinivibrio sp.]